MAMQAGALVALVVMSAGVALAAPANASGGTAALRVNDTNAIGAVGDGLLSLDEAIRLGNGTLSLSSLSPAERAQVDGAPGAGSGDLIQVVLGAQGVITVSPSAPGASALTRLVGNDGDTLDGGGAALTGQAPVGIGLLLSSSDLTVEHLTISGFDEDLVVDAGGRSLQDVRISHMHLLPARLGDLVVASRSSNGSLSGVTIADNVIEGGSTSDSLELVVIAASQAQTGKVDNTVLQDVLFARNEVLGGFEGLYVYGGVALGGTFDNAVTRRVRIIDNDFHGSSDASLNAAGAEGVGLVGTNSGIDRLTIAGNRIAANNWGLSIWGGEAFVGGVVQHGYVRHVDINDNTIVGITGNTSQCLVLEAGRADSLGAVTGSEITDAHVVGNHVSSCGVSGITVHAGFSGSGAVATGNTVSSVEIAHNDITSTPLGLVIRGGLSRYVDTTIRAVPGILTPGSLTRGNVSSGILVLGNRLTDDPEAIRLVGGEVQALGGISSANQVGPVSFVGNLVTGGSCTASADAGTGATGNVLLGACPS
jgi:hypothetical protein